MTDYPHKSNSWKKQEALKKWHSVIGIFITVILLLAVTNGIAKSFALGKYLGQSNWETKSAFAAVLKTEPLSIFIYNPSSEKITLVSLPDNSYFETNVSDKPLARIADIWTLSTEKELTAMASLIGNAPISYFIVMEDQMVVSQDGLEKLFKEFASLVTPIKILIDKPAGISQTNITRVDLFRLWWQLKSLSINNLNLVDASGYQEEIVLAQGEKVLGVDHLSLHRLLSGYLENRKVLEEGMEISINNLSGDNEKGILALDFVTSVGGKVTGINKSESSATTFIASSADSYTASYLAKLFKCDIKSLPDLGKGEVIVIVGQDFGQRF